MCIRLLPLAQPGVSVCLAERRQLPGFPRRGNPAFPVPQGCPTAGILLHLQPLHPLGLLLPRDPWETEAGWEKHQGKGSVLPFPPLPSLHTGEIQQIPKYSFSYTQEMTKLVQN